MRRGKSKDGGERKGVRQEEGGRRREKEREGRREGGEREINCGPNKSVALQLLYTCGRDIIFMSLTVGCVQ